MRSKLARYMRFAAAVLALGGGGAAEAQGNATAYPTRVVKLVVGFSPGGSNDILARIVGEKLASVLGQPFVVENKPGAGGMLAASSVMGSAADGYTLLVGAAGAMSIGPAVYTRMTYDTLRNFEPISLLGTFPLVMLVGGDLPFRTVSDLVAFSKANPERANYASVSPTFTLATELVKLKTGAKLERVSYRGSNDALMAVLSGQVTTQMVDPLPALPLLADGKLRALAVTSKTRVPELPDVPTLAEAGVPDSEALIWTGLFAPKGTPPEIVSRLEAEIGRIMRDPAVIERLRKLATDAASSSSAEFGAFIREDIARWSRVAREADVRIDP